MDRLSQPLARYRRCRFLHPGFDYSRFRIEHWQRFERMLRFARERDFIISVILYIADGRVHPAAGSDDERRYIRYAAARLSAFSNITWDLGDDLDSFRDEKWARETGTLLEGWGLLQASRHIPSGAHRTSGPRRAVVRLHVPAGLVANANMPSLLESRRLQTLSGRIIPQTNEEYGYEDHYPKWAPAPPGDSAEVLRRTAWDIAMAGAYGTAGETARRGNE